MNIVRGAVLALLAALVAAPVSAQRGRDAEPRRPQLAAGADTNDAAAYYAHGRNRLRANPIEAAAAFWWAMRLDPAQPEPYYARRTAVLMQNPSRLVRYMEGQRRTHRIPEVIAADSLYGIALSMSPFLYREFDRDMLNLYLREWAGIGPGSVRGMNETEILYHLDAALQRAGPGTRGWIAYAERRLGDATRHWAEAVRQAKRKAPLLLDRAEAFHLMGNTDSAVVQVEAALAELRRADDESDVFIYRSKAYYELALGVLHETLGRHEDAVAAYGRALQEDLSFHAAHHRMARMSLAAGDTAGALASFALGAAITFASPALLYEYATLLLRSDGAADAAEIARRLVATEPYFAGGYDLLGRALDAQGETMAALAAYEQYLARARSADRRRSEVVARMEALKRGDS